MKPTVSIIICTRNRARLLRPTLESVLATPVPAGTTAELLVIDNGSTDETRTVIESAPVGRISLRYIAEPRPGQCHARNTGLRESQGEVILFTDDDVRVPANWIAGMTSPILEGTADAVAGGIVFPPHVAYAVHCSPMRARRGWFASSDYLNPERPCNMIGANMAFHRRVLERVPSFDTELGPGALGFFDEALFSWQMEQAGFRLVGRLHVAVEHHFDLTRLATASLLDLAGKLGRSHAYIFHHWHHRRTRCVRTKVVLHLLRLGLHRASKSRTCHAALVKEMPILEQIAFLRVYAQQRRIPARYPHAAPAPRSSPA